MSDAHSAVTYIWFRKAKDVKFWKLVAREPIPSWHKDRLVLIGDAAHPMLPCKLVNPCAMRSTTIVSNFWKVQAQGGGQAIEDGAALGTLLDQLHDREAMEARLQLFEDVRRNRGSALQVLSNSSHPVPQSVCDAAARYFPEGKGLQNAEEISEYVYSFDVIKESKAILGVC